MGKKSGFFGKIKMARNKPAGSSPSQYAPFKMKAAGHKNSPMRKNFGIGDSEMAIKSSPTKFSFMRNAMSRARGMFGGALGKFADRHGLKPRGVFGGAFGGKIGQIMQRAQQRKKMMGNLMAGKVPPHGDESHSGGGAVGGTEAGVDAGMESPVEGEEGAAGGDDAGAGDPKAAAMGRLRAHMQAMRGRPLRRRGFGFGRHPFRGIF